MVLVACCAAVFWAALVFLPSWIERRTVERAIVRLKDYEHANGDAVSWSAVRDLLDIGPETVPHLIRALEHDDPVIAMGASITMGEMGSKAVPSLLSALEREGNPIAQSRAYDALCRLGPNDTEAVPKLIPALKHRAAFVRRRVAEVLGNIGNGALEAEPYLRELLKDEDRSVRGTAARSLVRICWGLSREELNRLSNEEVDALLRKEGNHAQGEELGSGKAPGKTKSNRLQGERTSSPPARLRLVPCSGIETVAAAFVASWRSRKFRRFRRLSGSASIPTPVMTTLRRTSLTTTRARTAAAGASFQTGTSHRQ